MKFLCKIGFHRWMVDWYFITGDARCERCGSTGIATPDGVINISKAELKKDLQDNGHQKNHL